MTAFSSLMPVCRTGLALLLFIVLTGELMLLIFKLSYFTSAKMFLPSGVLMLSDLILTVMPAAAYNMPWAIPALFILLSVLHLAAAFPAEKKRAGQSLSAQSIYEAANDLPMGTCFADPNGRIVLCNDTMRGLAAHLTGGYPQTMDEILSKTAQPPRDVTLLPGSCLKFADGRIFHFRLTGLTVDGEEGWQQLVAQDTTEQHRINEQLKRKTEKLKKTNARLEKMYGRMADDIREKESLELKVYIHDTIGRSLLTIQDIMHSGEETEKKLKSLREAVGVLSQSRPASKGTMAEVRETSAQMGVEVEVNGYIPPGTVTEELTVMAARECVTNCLRHAGGSLVTVDVMKMGGIYKVTITNNGEKPKGIITEGSGLSSLRRSVEASGGEMKVASYPDFALILNLPAKEKYEDDDDEDSEED